LANIPVAYPIYTRQNVQQGISSHRFRVSRISGIYYDPTHGCVGVVGGTNGVLNALLATVELGQEVGHRRPGLRS
jgi:hypothetical protein